MDRRGTDNPLAERILSSPARVVVVRGPAACGKTTAALAIYGRYLDDAGRPRCLLLAPNAPAAGRLRRKLIEASGCGVAVSPGVLTFGALAGRILAASGQRARPMGAFRRRLLLSGIVSELRDAGRLDALGSVADTPGLVVTLDRAIAELKRAAVEPDDLARAVGPAADKRADLVAVYRLYQQHLLASGAYDVEGQMWLARDQLRAAAAGDGPAPGVEGVAAIVADGFTDFTPTQLAMLHLLSARLERVAVTLPCADDGRQRMWRWTRRTLQNLRSRFGEDLVEIEAHASPAEDDHDGEDGLRRLWEAVFDLDARCEPPAGLEVVSAAGSDAEVAAAARRVKALLCAGAPAGSIGVLARRTEAYGGAIRRIFAEHDVPVAEPPVPLIDVPVVRFLLDVALLAPELAWRHCLRVIRNSYFRPQALGDYDAETVAAAEAVIREGNVLEGRESYAAAAARLAARAARRQDEDAEQDEPELRASGARRPGAEQIVRAGEMLQRLFDLARQAADPAGLAAAADALQLAGAAQAHGEPELVARDLRALAALRDCLAAMPDPAPAMAHLRDALGAVACPPARAEALVDVLDVLDARALRWDHVLLLGVGERQFPPRFVEGALIDEADRARWRRRGVVLDSRDDLTAREMLLFYLAVSRASKGLTLSYLESDASGRTGSPSGFLLSLLEACGGPGAAGVRRIPPGVMVPPAEELASRRDAFNAGLAALFRAESAPCRQAARWAADCQADKLRRAAAGIWARHRRWRPGECSEFDGRITDPTLLETLARRCPERTVFSAARLDTYGQCPWQYFAKYVLELVPLADPQRRLEPQSRGVFCHNVLYRLMRALAERAGGAVRLAETDEKALAAALDEAVAAEAEQVEATRPPYRVLWQVQLRQMRQALWEYLVRARSQRVLNTESLHFELAFGQEIDDAEAHDPASGPEPLTIATPAGEIRVRGRIDRVDRVRFEDVEGLLVVDYKTGRLPTDSDFAEGRSLQVPLYAAAAEALLGATCVGGAFHRIGEGRASRERFFAEVTASHGRAGYKVDEKYEEKLQAALATVGWFVEGMAAGRFDAAPTHPCPSYCPYRRICHYSPARAESLSAGGDEEDA